MDCLSRRNAYCVVRLLSQAVRHQLFAYTVRK